MEKAVLLAVKTGREDIDVDISLDELSDLALTAGAKTMARVVQAREFPDKLTYLGIGRMLELKDFIDQNEIDLIIADDELSPLQIDKVNDLTGVKVLDRTSLILDIFAKRANSKEGQLQVEMAQLKYLLPRLKGSREELSRLGGGIGTRGPGETKLEVDRRVIRNRIARVKREIEAMKGNREEQRKKRKQNHIPQVSLVGYTNAGKSSLLKELTGCETYIEDQLFATLDPLIRKWPISSQEEILLADTVGFIRKLPHDLVAAFRATLEELKDARVLLHVVDSVGIDYDAQIKAVEETLEAIGCKIPNLLVFSKADLLTAEKQALIKAIYPEAIMVSAKTKAGFQELTEAVLKKLKLANVELHLQLPYAKIDWLNRLYQEAEVKNVAYSPEGLKVNAIVNILLAETLLPYITKEE